MVMRPRLYSINMLVFAGFALVALPLLIAMLAAHAAMGELARTTSSVASDGVRVARDTQILLEQLTTVERNARQYRVVGGSELLALLEERHTRLLDILAQLDAHLPEPAPEAQTLRAGTSDLLAELVEDRMSADFGRFEHLHAEARALTARINAQIDSAVADSLRQVSDTRRALLRQGAALVPLAALIGLLFAVMIVRPVRALGRAIRQLGGGNMDDPIDVRGPADLHRLGQHLDWLRTQLAEVEREKARFLRHVSHELKTPLANIREGSELLLDESSGALTPGQAEIVSILRENGISLQTSIENLLNFNAWQDKHARLLRTRVDARNMVERVLASHRLALQRDHIRINVVHDFDQWWVDAEKVQVLLDNLLSNAVKFSPSGGMIELRLRAAGSVAIVEVCDDGPGVPPDERERVFDAFFQGGGPRRGHVKGTGIGLSVVRECARMHGGQAEVVYGEHRGGHFRITLPDALGA